MEQVVCGFEPSGLGEGGLQPGRSKCDRAGGDGIPGLWFSLALASLCAPFAWPPGQKLRRLDPGEPRVVTAADGRYAFGGLAAGHYLVREAAAVGWRNSGNSSYDLALAAGQSRGDKDFAQTQLGLVSGAVFKDANGNGKQDKGELPLPGVLVYLDANNDGKLDNGEGSFITGVNGKYSFSVKAGAYHVRRVNAKAGYLITVGAGQRVNVPDFADHS